MDSSTLSTRELHKIRSKMWDASMENHARYMNPETMLFDDKFVETRDCPSCGSSEYRVAFQKSGGTYVKCESCPMVYLNPVFRPEYLQDYYSQNHAVQSEIVELDNQFYKTLYNKGLDLISQQRPAGQSILDVGCSAGGFLDIAKGRGWKTFGLELNKRELEHSIKKGHQVQGQTIHNAQFSEKMDAITLWDVYEHIPDGHAFLKDAKKLLRENGVVFIQSPQSSSLAARILQQSCNMFDGLEHVNLYNQETLEQVARKSGFKLIAFETVIAELGVLNNYVNYDSPYFGSTANKENFLGILSAEEVLKMGLGYKFQAVLGMA